MINYNLKINFQDEKVLSSDLTFVSGDIGAYKLIFDFYDNGKKVDISKYTLSVKTKRSDGIKIASVGEIENGQAVFIPESNVYAIPGDLYLEVALCDAAGKYLTAKIIIASVLEGLGETDVKGAETPSVYVTLLSSVQSKIDQTNQLVRESIPVKGVDYFDGKDGVDGKDGIDGKDGYTPVKGVDYFTEEEKEELVSELDMKIDVVNKSIDEMKTNTYNYSNAVKGFCKGELIRIDDVSPNKHMVKCKTSVPIRVSSKNMISYPYAMSGKTSNGITFTVNHDNTITVKGTATANVGFTIVSLQQMLKTPIGTYYLSGCPAGGSKNTYYLQAVWYKNNAYQTQIEDTGSGMILKNSAIDRGDVAIQITIKAGTELPDDGITFKPQFELGSNASPYEPPTTGSWYTPDNNNMVEFVSNATSMTIVTDTKGVEVECEYNRDANKVIEKLTNAIISLGGNV